MAQNGRHRQGQDIMAKTLNERDIIKLFREEYDKQLVSVIEELDTSGYSGQDADTDVLSVGLKIRHSKSNLRYAIDSIGMNDIILKTPEGDQFTVTRQEIEKDYKLD